MPKPTGSGAAEKTIGSVAVASLAARAEGSARGEDQGHAEADELGRERGQLRIVSFRPPEHDHDVAALEKARLGEARSEGREHGVGFAGDRLLRKPITGMGGC